MSGSVRSRVSWRERRWTPEEDNLIRELYPNNGAAVLAERLGLLPSLIRNRARWLGVCLKDSARRRGYVDRSKKIRAAHAAITARSPLIPPHVRACEEFSLDWYKAQQRAFAQAMRDNPTERPS